MKTLKLFLVVLILMCSCRTIQNHPSSVNGIKQPLEQEEKIPFVIAGFVIIGVGMSIPYYIYK